MRFSVISLFALLALLVAAPSALAQASFQGLGHLPGGNLSQANAVSIEGRVVAGFSTSDRSQLWEAFRWTEATGMVALPAIPGERFQSVAGGVSADGSIVVGSAFAGEALEAVYWTAGGTLHRLGDLPGGKQESYGGSASADGSVLSGTGNSALGQEAFIWTASTGLVGLGNLPGPSYQGGAGRISEDGRTLPGSSLTFQGRQSWRWQAHTGMVALGGLSAPPFEGGACCTSADGRIIAGAERGQVIREIFRWTEGHGMVGLGHPLPTHTYSTAFGMDRRGWRIVGTSTAPSEPWRAVLWEAHRGMRELRDVLEQDYNLDLRGWELADATHISPCGTAIVGRGVNPEGQQEAFLARIPPFCYADCDRSSGLGVLDFFDFLCFQNRFLEADILYADCDQNGVLDFFDFLCFQNEFLAGCP